MLEYLTGNSFWGVFLTIGAFSAGTVLQKKFRSSLLNPIFLSAVVIGAFLLAADIPVKEYQESCAPLQFLLTPATICFAVGLYEQLEKLKEHLVAIICGILSGTVVSLLSIRLLCHLFGFDEAMTASLLPKSITTAIGIVLSEEAGGVVAITSSAIILTGILGNMFGQKLCRIFHITHPVSIGVAFGTASHAIGTSRARDMSELAGAAGSLSLTVAGLVTTLLFEMVLKF